MKVTEQPCPEVTSPAVSSTLLSALQSMSGTTSEEDDGIIISSVREGQMNRGAKSFSQSLGVRGGCPTDVAGPRPGRSLEQVSGLYMDLVCT